MRSIYLPVRSIYFRVRSIYITVHSIFFRVRSIFITVRSIYLSMSSIFISIHSIYLSTSSIFVSMSSVFITFVYMLRFKVKEILDATGIKAPGAWLQKHCEMSHPKAYNILNNKQKSINLRDFSKLCENLNCTPNDLLYWEETPRTKIPDTHPCMTQLTKPEPNSNWFKIFTQLSSDKIRELHQVALEKLNKK